MKCGLKPQEYAQSKNILSLCLKILFVINCLALTASSARIKRAIMMNMGASGVKCEESTITKSNLTSNIILTGTVKKCDTSKTPYFCEVQVI